MILHGGAKFKAAFFKACLQTSIAKCDRSHEWGTLPWHWYFTSALPRALLAAAPLVLVGFHLERRARGPTLVALLFVVLYSFLPHKEVCTLHSILSRSCQANTPPQVRFLFPVLPLFNIAAACGLVQLHRRRAKDPVGTMLALSAYGVFVCDSKHGRWYALV